MFGNTPYGFSNPMCPVGCTGGSITVKKGKYGDHPAGSKRYNWKPYRR